MEKLPGTEYGTNKLKFVNGIEHRPYYCHTQITTVSTLSLASLSLILKPINFVGNIESLRTRLSNFISLSDCCFTKLVNYQGDSNDTGLTTTALNRIEKLVLFILFLEAL